jgi:hypothetical protein
MASRKPPADVLRILRTEVGFGCPVPDCGNPYLTWHHFDPPYAVEEHHRPEGMISLCREHHDKADAGAYTTEQLRSFKTNRVNSEKVRGSFDWLRNRLVARVGGTFFYDVDTLIRIDEIDVISFFRDTEGYLRLNVQLPSLSPEPRARIDGNIWSNIGTPSDLVSPPGGKRLSIRYDTGDRLSVEFLELNSEEAAAKRFGTNILNSGYVKFPVTLVEVDLAIGSVDILSVSPTTTSIGYNTYASVLVAFAPCGFSAFPGLPWRHNTSRALAPQFPRTAPCPCKSGKMYRACHGVVRWD